MKKKSRLYLGAIYDGCSVMVYSLNTHSMQYARRKFESYCRHGTKEFVLDVIRVDNVAQLQMLADGLKGRYNIIDKVTPLFE